MVRTLGTGWILLSSKGAKDFEAKEQNSVLQCRTLHLMSPVDKYLKQESCKLEMKDHGRAAG